MGLVGFTETIFSLGCSWDYLPGLNYLGHVSISMLLRPGQCSWKLKIQRSSPCKERRFPYHGEGGVMSGISPSRPTKGHTHTHTLGRGFRGF